MYLSLCFKDRTDFANGILLRVSRKLPLNVRSFRKEEKIIRNIKYFIDTFLCSFFSVSLSSPTTDCELNGQRLTTIQLIIQLIIRFRYIDICVLFFVV